MVMFANYSVDKEYVKKQMCFDNKTLYKKKNLLQDNGWNITHLR